jgi:hypothetical protein
MLKRLPLFFFVLFLGQQGPAGWNDVDAWAGKLPSSLDQELGSFVAEHRNHFEGKLENVKWVSNPAALTFTSGKTNRNGVFTSKIIATRFPAKDFIPYWNIDYDSSLQGFAVSFRFFSSTGASDWFPLGIHGTVDSNLPLGIPNQPGWGESYFSRIQLSQPANRFQFRIIFFSETPEQPIRLKKLGISYGGDRIANRHHATQQLSPASDPILVPAASRSQLEITNYSLARMLCLPTTVAMALESYGVNLTTHEVARRLWWREQGLFGIWSRAAQYLSEKGLDSWLERFNQQAQVLNYLRAGILVLASVSWNSGELPGACMDSSPGHFMLIHGINENGNYIVNDPICFSPSGANRVYGKKEFENIWFGHGGVGIVTGKVGSLGYLSACSPRLPTSIAGNQISCR